MQSPFRPAQDSEPARWLEQRLRTFGRNVLSVVPSGFEVYARVFHPAWRVTLETRSPLRWAEVAAQNGRTPHREMQWPSIRGEEPPYDHSKLKKGDTWVEGPEEGNLPPEVAATLWPLLKQHTGTSERCFFAVWEGFGCLPRSVHDAPAFEIPGRKFHLFEASIEKIEETFCTNDADEATGMGVLVLANSSKKLSPAEIADAIKDMSPFPAHYQSANLWWSEDRAWCVATEIDFETTYVAGSEGAVDAILECDALEACWVEPMDGITYASDTVNPKPASY